MTLLSSFLKIFRSPFHSRYLHVHKKSTRHDNVGGRPFQITYFGWIEDISVKNIFISTSKLYKLVSSWVGHHTFEERSWKSHMFEIDMWTRISPRETVQLVTVQKLWRFVDGNPDLEKSGCLRASFHPGGSGQVRFYYLQLFLLEHREVTRKSK